ncbi:MAG: leucine-rich repeat domain-containing protein [Spirochaetaceae bacterium]|jgi:hypothetical protein|nr:leucine-rich repeat domain-containing protein [Spirochaetaceae bacterium]
MKAALQFFHGTTDEWETVNPRLYEASLGVEFREDGGMLLKIGRADPAHPGLTLPWNELPYVDKSAISGLPEELEYLAQRSSALEAQLAAEAAARAAADTALGDALALEAQARIGGDTALRDELEAESAARQEAGAALGEALAAEAQAREGADAALEEAVAAKIDKAVAGDSGRLLQGLSVEEGAVTSVSLTKKSVGVAGGEVTEEAMPLPVASTERAGIMPAESFLQIQANTLRLDSIEGKKTYYLVELESAAPTQTELQAAYAEASGNTGAPADLTALDDRAFGKTYVWYETANVWADMGETGIAVATNSSLGVVKGSTLPGKTFVEEDGSMSLNGWDATQAALINLENNKVDKETGKGLSEADFSAGEKGKLAGIEAGAQVNPGAATASAAGLLTAAEKIKLAGIQAGAQVNPGEATASAAGLMSAEDKAKLDGMSAGGGGSGGGGAGGYTGATFVVDSDQALLDWANAAAGNDYSTVLIKSGSWTLTKGVNLTVAGTKVVVGEPSSFLIFAKSSNGSTVMDILYYSVEPVGMGYWMNGVNLKGTSSAGIGLNGFKNCTNLTNCTFYNTATNTLSLVCGFKDCNNLTDCINTNIFSGSHNSIGKIVSQGFSGCDTLFNCTSTITSTAKGWDSGDSIYRIIFHGFHDCAGLTDCRCTVTDNAAETSYTNVFGFYNCASLSNCTATVTANLNYYYGNAYAFKDCTYLNGCTGTAKTYRGASTFNMDAYAHGFDNCTNLTSCTGTGIISVPNTYGSGCGFYQCKGMLQNRGGTPAPTTATYKYCYVSASGAGTAPGDSAAGGWNIP